MLKEKGFTLFEMLVVIGIVAVFSSIAVFNFSEARGQMALKRAAYQLIQDLRRAEEMAMSSTQSESCLLPAKGYGIYIYLGTGGSNKSYKLYADTTTDGTVDCETAPATPCYGYYNFPDCIVETINMQEKGVIISGVTALNQQVGINFKPPNPDVKIKWLQGSELEITLALESNPSKTKKVIVSQTGVFQIR